MQKSQDEQRSQELPPTPKQEQGRRRSGEGLESIVSRMREEEARKKPSRGPSE